MSIAGLFCICKNIKAVVVTVDFKICTASKSPPSEISQPSLSVCLILRCSNLRRLWLTLKLSPISAAIPIFRIRGKAFAILAAKASKWITVINRCNFFEGLRSARNGVPCFFGINGCPEFLQFQQISEWPQCSLRELGFRGFDIPRFCYTSSRLLSLLLLEREFF